MKSPSRALYWVKLLFTPLALLFLILAAWHSIGTLSAVINNAGYGYLFSAILIWMLAHFLAPVFTLIALSACGSSVSYLMAFNTHVGRLPARYLPGGIWHTVARVSDLHSIGIPSSHLTTFIILENTIALSTSFVLGGMAVAWYQEPSILRIFALTAAIGGASALLLCPYMINRWILKSPDHLSIKSFLKAISMAIIFWLITTSAFLSYLTAFPGVTHNGSFIEIGGTYLFSWGVGFIAVFAPQGIGIFEAVAADILHSPLSLGSLAVLIAGFRLIILSADILTWVMWVISKLIYPPCANTTQKTNAPGADNHQGQP